MVSEESPMADFITIKVNKKEYERMEAELSRLTLSAAESQREVERLAAMVIYDCREAGVCPDLADAIDALGLMTEQRDGADALIKAERTRAEKAEADRDKYKAALEKIASSTMSMYSNRDGMLRSLLEIAAEAVSQL